MSDQNGFGTCGPKSLGHRLTPSALHPHEALIGFDEDAVHRGEVDEETSLDRGQAGDRVSAAAHGDHQAQQPSIAHDLNAGSTPIALEEFSRPQSRDLQPEPTPSSAAGVDR